MLADEVSVITFPATERASRSWDCRLQPIVSDGEGPFVVIPEKSSASTIYKVLKPRTGKGLRTAQIKIGVPPKFPVYDLRTGKRIGQFNGGIPFWWPNRLSPDGQTLLTVAGTLDGVNPTTAKWAPSNDNLEPPSPGLEPSKLWVWRQNKSQPVKTLTLSGKLRWFSFLDRYQVILIVDTTDARRVERVDLTGKRPNSTVTFPIKARHEVAESPPTRHHDFEEAVAELSPGGQHLAVVHEDQLHLLSTKQTSADPKGTLKPLGTLTFRRSDGRPTSASHPEFSRDGKQMQIATETQVLRCDLVAGKLLTVTSGSERADPRFPSARRQAAGPHSQVLRWRDQGSSCFFGKPPTPNQSRRSLPQKPAVFTMSNSQLAGANGANRSPQVPTEPQFPDFPAIGYSDAPGAWRVELPARAADPGSRRVDWSIPVAAWQTNLAAALSIDQRRLLWGTLNLQTGMLEPDSVPVEELTRYSGSIADLIKLGVTVSADGNWLAYPSLNDRFSGVTVHHRDQPSKLDYRRRSRAHWTMIAGNHLLVAGKDDLECFDLKAEKPAYRLMLSFHGARLKGCLPVGPSGAWFALPTERGIRIIETATGTSLGDLPMAGQWQRFAVSPNGHSIALCHQAPGGDTLLTVYSLADQSQKTFEARRLGDLLYLGVSDDGFVFFSLKRQPKTSIFDPLTERVVSESELVRMSPDGRAWRISGDQRGQQVVFPDPTHEQHALLRDDARRSMPSKVSASVHLDLLDKSSVDEQGLLERLAQSDFLVAQGPYQLHIKAVPIEDPGWILINHHGSRIPIPAVEVRWQLIDEGGQVLWEQVDQKTYDKTAKFPAKFAGNRPDEIQVSDLQDMKDADPRDIIIRELISTSLTAAFPQIPIEYQYHPSRITNGRQQLELPVELIPEAPDADADGSD